MQLFKKIRHWVWELARKSALPSFICSHRGWLNYREWCVAYLRMSLPLSLRQSEPITRWYHYMTAECVGIIWSCATSIFYHMYVLCIFFCVSSLINKSVSADRVRFTALLRKGAFWETHLLAFLHEEIWRSIALSYLHCTNEVTSSRGLAEQKWVETASSVQR